MCRPLDSRVENVWLGMLPGSRSRSWQLLCPVRPRTTHDTIPSCAIPSRIFVAVLRARNPHPISGIGGSHRRPAHPLPILITPSAHLRLFSIEPSVVVVVRWKGLKGRLCRPSSSPNFNISKCQAQASTRLGSEAHILTNETVFQLHGAGI
jgi:hypothetical protein